MSQILLNSSHLDGYVKTITVITTVYLDSEKHFFRIVSKLPNLVVLNREDITLYFWQCLLAALNKGYMPLLQRIPNPCYTDKFEKLYMSAEKDIA